MFTALTARTYAKSARFALGQVRENVRQASGSGVGLLQAGWDVSAGVKESPDVDGGFGAE